MYTETCCVCGIPFGIPETIQKARLADGKKFYCSNGHGQHYADSQIAKLERRVDKLVKEFREQSIALDWYVDFVVPNLMAEVEQLKVERKSARCSAASYRGHLARVIAKA